MYHGVTRRRVPILPLRNAVLFPGSTPTYHIGRTSSLLLVHALSPGDTIAVFTQKDARTIEVENDDLHEVGTLARVTAVAPAPKDQLVLSVEGTERVRLEEIVSTDPHLEAEVTVLDVAPATTAAKEAARRLKKDVLEDIGVEIEIDSDDPGRLADRVASTLELPLEDKIDLLAETDIGARIELLAERAAAMYARDDESGSSKKERVLHTRVPAVLERELKRLAESLRVPVSNLVRAVLEDAVDVADKAGENVETRLKRFAKNLEDERDRLKRRVQRDPLTDVFAFQPVKLAVAAQCAKCDAKLERGTSANLGLTDKPRPGNERVFVCDACLPND
jgi:ATP-dependent Lon protease